MVGSGEHRRGAVLTARILTGDCRDILPTPTAINRPHEGQRNTWKNLAKKGQITTEQAHAAINGKLSAAWVTRLMGYPDDWLTL